MINFKVTPGFWGPEALINLKFILKEDRKKEDKDNNIVKCLKSFSLRGSHFSRS